MKLPLYTIVGILATLSFAHAKPLPDSCDKKAVLEDTRSTKNDPLEPINRSILKVNRLLDGLLIKPVAQAYQGITPACVREGVGNVLNNLWGPMNVVNFAFQGEGGKMSTQLGRFLINTTLGLGGIFDVASRMGLKREETSFGKTLAKYHVPSGPYVVLPLIGPSDLRDTAGRLTTLAIDPVNRVAIHNGSRNLLYWRFGAEVIHTRSQNIKALDAVEKNALDFYDTLRNIYLETKRESGSETTYKGPRPIENNN